MRTGGQSMTKQSIWYEIYSGRKIKWDSFTKYFEPNGSDKTWYIYYVEEDGEPKFDLHAHIEGDTVVKVNPFKADVFGGHGRPTIHERSLTASEKKYSIEIFDECFPDRVGESYIDIVERSISNQIEFQGYKICKRMGDGVSFYSAEGKRVKLSYKNLIKAIDYSHIDLTILRDMDAVSEFAQCFGIKNYEPLAAILLTIDPSNYEEYAELDRKYRYEKMHTAVCAGKIELCEKYVDVLSDPQNNVQKFCEASVRNGNRELLFWLIDNIFGVPYNLNSALAIAIKEDNESLFDDLLNSGKVDISRSDSKKWDSPIYIAVNSKNHKRYVMSLLKHGFVMPAVVGCKLYESCTMDEIAELLSYKVEFDFCTIERIFSSGRHDIIAELEKRPLCFCTIDDLFAAYIHCGDYEKFSVLLKSGYRNNSVDLFSLAYKHSKEWTDFWLQHGFDINHENARLLRLACYYLEVDWAIYLLEKGADPKLKEAYSLTLFEQVSRIYCDSKEDVQKKYKLCKYLLEFGLDPIKESCCAPSILTCLFGKSEEFDFYLIDWLADHNQLNFPDLLNDFESIKHLPIANILDRYLGHFNSNVLRYFIEKGATTNAENITNDKLFLGACRWCDLNDLQLVVSAGANVNEQDDDHGINGLYVAVKKKRPYEIIKYLIELGVDVNSVRKSSGNFMKSSPVIPNTSVLDIAEQQGDSQIIELLRLEGALHASEIN